MSQNQSTSLCQKPKKTVLTNVRVFDGWRVCEPGTITIDGGLIGTEVTSADEVHDCAGKVLLPGLVDAHVHLLHTGHLEQLCKAGVTTALDMGCWPVDRVDSLRGRTGVTDIRSAGTGASAPGSRHSRVSGRPKQALVANTEEAARYVSRSISEGSDYIKIIVDVPGGPDQATLNALVDSARDYGKLSIAHAVSGPAFEMAQKAKVDIITHVPLDQSLDEAFISRMVAEKRIVIPTLTMMKSIVDAGKASSHFKFSAPLQSVEAMYRAGVTILAGTDANNAEHSPVSVVHGESIHQEMELLVQAGLSTVDALRAATFLPAEVFGLRDRGMIEQGRRADLILIDEDPTEDIRRTRGIRRVWCNGIEVAL